MREVEGGREALCMGSDRSHWFLVVHQATRPSGSLVGPPPLVARGEEGSVDGGAPACPTSSCELCRELHTVFWR